MEDSFKHSESIGAHTKKLRRAEDSFAVYSDIEVIVRDHAGRIKHHSWTHNIRTNVGIDFWNTQLFATGAAGSQANWMGITTDNTTPVATDTSLASEETANGLARAQATVTHTSGQTSTVLSHTWTYSGSVTKVIAKAALFTAAGPPVAGSMCLESLLSSTATVNSNGDQVTINWTVNY
jgi:hypothetical protein